MTRREALLRAGVGTAFGLAGGTAFGEQPASRALPSPRATPSAEAIPANQGIPPGVVTLEDFEGLARQRLSARAFESVRGGAAAAPTC
jgi:hypothetical protein